MTLIYIGNGAFLPGVPARDLSADEVKQYGGADYLVATGIYATPKKESK
jgi:thiamine monophosphate synthase